MKRRRVGIVLGIVLGLVLGLFLLTPGPSAHAAELRPVVSTFLEVGPVEAAQRTTFFLSLGVVGWAGISALAAFLVWWSVGRTRKTRSPERLLELRKSSLILFVSASALHGACIPVSLFVTKLIVDHAAGGEVLWSQIIRALDAVGLLWILVLGVALQLFFVVNAGVGAGLSGLTRPGEAAALLGAGLFAIGFSLLIFGGIFGALGGGMFAIGAAIEMLVGDPD